MIFGRILKKINKARLSKNKRVANPDHIGVYIL